MAKYIGKRIVPIHRGVWNQSQPYEMLSIVLEETSGDSYISKRAVPAGTAITDETFWALHSKFSQQIKDMSDQLSETEQRIRQNNEETEAAIQASNRDTAEHIDATVESARAEMAEAERVMTEQKQSFDEQAAQLNTRMDAVLAAGTGDGETEIVDGRVDAEGVQHDTIGAAIRSVGEEIKEAREGLGGVEYPHLAEAMRSFSSPFAFQHRLAIHNSNAVLGSKTDLTRAGFEDICDSAGTVRAVKFTAEILQEYNISSIMGRSTISMSDFRQLLLGKQIVIQFVSPIEGVVNFSLGSSSTSGGGPIDDPNGSPLGTDGNLGLNSISYNMTVSEGYNEIVLNLYEELPQIQRLMEVAEEKNWGTICLSMIPFKWGKVTYVPEVGRTYEFIMAVCDEMTEGADDFSVPSLATAMRAKYALTAEKANHADQSAYSLRSGSAVNSENSMNAGIVPLGEELYTTNAKLRGGIDPESRIVKISFGADVELTTGQGFSIRIGTVGELRGKTLLLRRVEEPGFTFKTMAINFGANYGNRSYFSVPSAVTAISDNLYRVDYDRFLESAVRGGVSTSDDVMCWMMFFGNHEWDTSVLQDGSEICNQYQLFEPLSSAFVYSQEIAELTSQVSQLAEERSNLLENINSLSQQINTLIAQTGEIDVGQGNILWGKKWFATGDSFTSGGSVEDDKYFTDEPFMGKIKTYPLFIGRRNNMEVINDSISGSIMALDKSYLADPENVSVKTRNPFSYTRYLAIPEDVDYITLWFGINDAGHTNLGTIDDTTNETFYGAWNVVMEWILTNRPWAHVGIIITNGSSASYREAEREIARKWGVPYLDMMGDDQVPVMTLGRENELGLCRKAYDLRRTTFGVGHSPSGDSHPCWQAHEYESTFIEAFLRRL